ncbi:MAG: RDD family protein [Phycisphaeraceae bacterium]|nr:RDD family protein [Phycisphaeraceae bacterium]
MALQFRSITTRAAMIIALLMLIVLSHTSLTGGLRSVAADSPNSGRAEYETDHIAPVGDETGIWSVQPRSEGRFRFWYAPLDADPPGFADGPELFGRIARHGVAAGRGRLWIIYDDLAVQSLEPRQLPVDQLWRFQPRWAAALPRGVRIQRLLTIQGTLWAIVRIEDRHSLRRIADLPAIGDAHDHAPARRDGGEPAREETDWVDPGPSPIFSIPGLGLPTPPDELDPTGQTDSEPEREPENREPDQAEPQAQGGVELPRFAILRLSRNDSQWQRLNLPRALSDPDAADADESEASADSAALDRLWIAENPADSDKPVILVDYGSGRSLHVWQATGSDNEQAGWRLTRYEIDTLRPPGGDGTMEVLSIGRQVALGVTMRMRDAVECQLWLLRDDVGRRGGDGESPDSPVSPLRLGQLRIGEVEPGAVHALIAAGQRIGLAVTESTDRVRWTTLDLRGQVEPEIELRKRRDTTFPTAARILAITVMYLVTFGIVGVLIRQSAAASAPKLPANSTIAPLNFRFVAGGWDLLLAGMITGIVTGTSMLGLMVAHPVMAASWADMAPFLAWMMTYLSICLVTETLGLRGLGKAIMGLRVIDREGLNPRPGPVLIRNLLKIIDLIALPLLLLPILTPHRQRLSDLASQTYVIKLTDHDEQPPRDEDDSLRNSESRKDDA